MNAERWERVASLYHAALEQDPSTRDSFLDAATDGDDSLRREVSSLLAEEATDSLLDAPVLHSAAEAFDVEMALPSGTRLGHYQIDRLLGLGGMGEVYGAQDTKLGRGVALKLLPPDLAADGGRLARFQREAQMLASLNHPSIGAIYGVEEGTLSPPANVASPAVHVHALVLELVEGPTLAERIARGPIPLDDAISIGTEIASALHSAHQHWIVHRDLKPANIKLRPDGAVKVLDFGIAKLTESTSEPSHGSASVMTLDRPGMTGANAVIGTPAYVSPEQAKGEEADRRSDVWSFGCVLYEMLAGTRVFGAGTIAETLAMVFKAEPDWQALPADTPESIRTLLERCLRKDRRLRISDMSVVLYLLDEAANQPARGSGHALPPVQSARRTRRRMIVGSVLAGVLLASAMAWTVGRRNATPPTPVRFEVATPSAHPLTPGNARSVDISPDGSRVVYRAGTEWQLVVRELNDLAPHPVTGATGASMPFFSADGRSIAFFGSGHLKRIPVEGGTAIDLCPIVAPQRGGTWGPNDTIIFATADRASGLLRIPSAGGTPQVLTTPDASQGEFDHWYPEFLPAGRGVLFTIVRGGAEESDVAVLDLATGRRKVLIRGASQARYIDSGHVVYAAAGGTRAVRFDLDALAVLGDPVPVIERLMTTSIGMAHFATSRTGSLVYVPDQAADSEPQRSLVWVDRHGRERPVGAPIRAFTAARLSPDGSRIALGVGTRDPSIWLWDVRREVLTPLNSDSGAESEPVWTADGTRIVFTSPRGGSPNLYWQAADGSGRAEPLSATPQPQYASSVSSDGTKVFVTQLAGPTTRADIGVLVTDGQRRMETLVQEASQEFSAEASPDGRWLAYQSDESGQHEVYVRP
jgi:eukaryotic-like serine/threonine-protein kinase